MSPVSIRTMVQMQLPGRQGEKAGMCGLSRRTHTPMLHAARPATQLCPWTRYFHSSFTVHSTALLMNQAMGQEAKHQPHYPQTQCPGLLLTPGVLMTTYAVLFLQLYAGTKVLGVFPKWKNRQNCLNFTKIKVAAGKEEEKEMMHSLKKQRSFQFSSHTAGPSS